MELPILVEPSYEGSVWGQQTLDGITQECARRKYTLRRLDAEGGTRDADEGRMALVIGSSLSWVPEAVSRLNRQGIASILLSFDSLDSIQARGIVRMDYSAATQQLIDYLTGCGRKRIALYGFNPNSSADVLKRAGFERRIHEATEALFVNQASLEECYHTFRPQCERFDAVICANDAAAVSLLTHLRRDGISVPEQLYLTSFGNTTLSQYAPTPITSATLDHFEVGRQAVRLYSYLYHQEAATSVSVRVQARLIIRESTANQPWQEMPDTEDAVRDIDFYSDPEAERLLLAGNLLALSDETDMAYLHGLLEGETSETLQGRLFLSASALRYRLRRIMSAAHCATRTQLMDFLAFCRENGLL